LSQKRQFFPIFWQKYLKNNNIGPWEPTVQRMQEAASHKQKSLLTLGHDVDMLQVEGVDGPAEVEVDRVREAVVEPKEQDHLGPMLGFLDISAEKIEEEIRVV
jgi:hypothetical protein